MNILGFCSHSFLNKKMEKVQLKSIDENLGWFKNDEFCVLWFDSNLDIGLGLGHTISR